MNKHMVWVFRELVSVLLSNLEEGRNVDTIFDCMINHELDQMNLSFLVSFFVILMFLYSNTCDAISDIELILYFLPLEALTRSGVFWRTRLESSYVKVY